MAKYYTILAEASQLKKEGQEYTIATVAKIEGSAYRRPGARMIITREGKTTGIISSGCLEGEVIQHALEVLDEKTPRVVTFDVNEADPILGFGSGCGGTVHVLIEYVSPESLNNPFDLIAVCHDRRTSGVMATVIHSGLEGENLARHRLYLSDNTVVGDARPPEIFADADRDVEEVRSSARTQIRRYTTGDLESEVLFEWIEPPVRLLLFGTGLDAEAVVRFASILQWDCIVVGNRPEAELARRFPLASSHVFLMHPDRVHDYVSLDPYCAVVIMNHNFVRDRQLLASFLNAPVRYLGALGPRSRTERMLNDLREQNVTSVNADCIYLHAPVGLDIGAETPDEIGLSIVAEIQAVFAGRRGGKLSETPLPIHENVPIYASIHA